MRKLKAFLFDNDFNYLEFLEAQTVNLENISAVKDIKETFAQLAQQTENEEDIVKNVFIVQLESTSASNESSQQNLS